MGEPVSNHKVLTEQVSDSQRELTMRTGAFKRPGNPCTLSMRRVAGLRMGRGSAISIFHRN